MKKDMPMDRLTVKSADFGEHYALKAMCSFDDKDNIKDEDSCMACCNTANGVCSRCDVQKAFDRLAAYEDTAFTPEEITTMKSEYSDTYQAHLNQLCDIKDKRIAELEAENKRLHDLVDIVARKNL